MILLVKDIQHTYDSSPVRSLIDMQDWETSQNTSYSELLSRKRHWTSMGFSGSNMAKAHWSNLSAVGFLSAPGCGANACPLNTCIHVC